MENESELETTYCDFIDPTPGAHCTCDMCGETLIAKCGQINVWHWSHIGGTDCDPWHEHETPWHRRLKKLALEAFSNAKPEHTIRNEYGVCHRADIYLADSGHVLEFQHSPISANEIYSRECFYGNMVWIFDVNLAMNDFRFTTDDRETHHVFKWKHARRSLVYASKPIILHCSAGSYDFFFLVKKHYRNFKHGWGYEFRTLRGAMEAAVKP